MKPKVDRKSVQNGSEPRTCPQAVNDWQARFFPAIGQFTSKQPFNLSAWEQTIIDSPVKRLDFNKLIPVTEDCLFLDVYVPRKVLEKAAQSPHGFKGAAVLAWVSSLFALQSMSNRHFRCTDILRFTVAVIS